MAVRFAKWITALDSGRDDADAPFPGFLARIRLSRRGGEDFCRHDDADSDLMMPLPSARSSRGGGAFHIHAQKRAFTTYGSVTARR